MAFDQRCSGSVDDDVVPGFFQSGDDRRSGVILERDPPIPPVGEAGLADDLKMLAFGPSGMGGQTVPKRRGGPRTAGILKTNMTSMGPPPVGKLPRPSEEGFGRFQTAKAASLSATECL